METIHIIQLASTASWLPLTTTDYCWRSWMSPIAAPYKSCVDWLILWHATDSVVHFLKFRSMMHRKIACPYKIPSLTNKQFQCLASDRPTGWKRYNADTWMNTFHPRLSSQLCRKTGCYWTMMLMWLDGWTRVALTTAWQNHWTRGSCRGLAPTDLHPRQHSNCSTLATCVTATTTRPSRENAWNINDKPCCYCVSKGLYPISIQHMVICTRWWSRSINQSINTFITHHCTEVRATVRIMLKQREMS